MSTTDSKTVCTWCGGLGFITVAGGHDIPCRRCK